jgi:tyrosyl-tRNA synthetase
VPLLTTSEGKKMGKTEKGAVWIDPDKTTPYDYFQFWRNTADDMVGTCLRFFTFIETEEIEELEKKQGADINEVKVRLAYEATAIIHGEEEAKKAKETAGTLFSSGGAGGAEPTFQLERADVEKGFLLLDLTVELGVFKSKSEARRMIQQGGLKVNEQKVSDIGTLIQLSDFEDGKSCYLRKGKKHYYRLEI